MNATGNSLFHRIGPGWRFLGWLVISIAVVWSWFELRVYSSYEGGAKAAMQFLAPGVVIAALGVMITGARRLTSVLSVVGFSAVFPWLVLFWAAMIGGL